MLKKRCIFHFFAVYFLLSVSSPVYAQELTATTNVVLVGELKTMLQEVRILKSFQMESSRELENWKTKCELQEKKLQNVLQSLETVSQKLEDSEMTVIELQKLVEELREQQTVLKNEYLSVCKSLEYQKKKQKLWMITALGFMTLAVSEGIIIICK